MKVPGWDEPPPVAVVVEVQGHQIVHGFGNVDEAEHVARMLHRGHEGEEARVTVWERHLVLPATQG